MEIKGRDVLKIKRVSTGNKYNVEKEHKFFGKTYNLYNYNGTGFTVPSDDEFVGWKDSGALYSVTFTEGSREVTDSNGVLVTVPTLQLVGCTNIAQETAMATAESKLNYISTKYDPAKVDESLLESLA
jgi:hypothetical protein